MAPDLQVSRYTSEMISTPKINTVSMVRLEYACSINKINEYTTRGGNIGGGSGHVRMPGLPHPFFLPSSSRLNDSCLIGHRKRTHIRSTTRKIFNSQMLELINTVSKNALQSWFVSRASRNSGTKAGRRPGMGLAQRQQKCIAGALPQITLEVLRLRRLERRHVQR